MLKLIAALFAVGSLMAIAIPASAEDNSSVTQEVTSTMVVTGDGNSSVHTSDQRARQQGRSGGNSEVIQRVVQDEDTYGHGNSTYINSRQDADTRSRSSNR